MYENNINIETISKITNKNTKEIETLIKRGAK